MKGFWAETVRRLTVQVAIEDDAPPVLAFYSGMLRLASRPSFDRYDQAFARALETLPVRLRLQGETSQDGSITAVLGAVLDFSSLPSPPRVAAPDDDILLYPLGTLWRGRIDRSFPRDAPREIADMLGSLVQLPVRTQDQIAIEALLASV